MLTVKSLLNLFLEEQLDTSIEIKDTHRTPGRQLRFGAKPRLVVSRCHSNIYRDRILKKAPGALKTKHFREREYKFQMILKRKLENMAKH